MILAIRIFGSLKKRTVLLVGAGKIGKLCAKQLTESGIERLYITNRTAEHADALAKELSGEVIPFEKMDEMYEKADIIITSITSSKPLITKNSLINEMENLFLLLISVFQETLIPKRLKLKTSIYSTLMI